MEKYSCIHFNTNPVAGERFNYYKNGPFRLWSGRSLVSLEFDISLYGETLFIREFSDALQCWQQNNHDQQPV